MWLYAEKAFQAKGMASAKALQQKHRELVGHCDQGAASNHVNGSG